MERIEIEYIDGSRDFPLHLKISEKGYRVKIVDGNESRKGKGYSLKKLCNLMLQNGVISFNNGDLSFDRLRNSKRFVYPEGLEKDLRGYKSFLDERKKKAIIERREEPKYTRKARREHYAEKQSR